VLNSTDPAIEEKIEAMAYNLEKRDNLKGFAYRGGQIDARDVPFMVEDNQKCEIQSVFRCVNSKVHPQKRDILKQISFRFPHLAPRVNIVYARGSMHTEAYSRLCWNWPRRATRLRRAKRVH
jgi:hypothetical protein